MDLDTDVRGAVGCLNGFKNGPNAGKVGQPSKGGDPLKKRKNADLKSSSNYCAYHSCSFPFQLALA
jgi:hypothetical protein